MVSCVVGWQFRYQVKPPYPKTETLVPLAVEAGAKTRTILRSKRGVGVAAAAAVFQPLIRANEPVHIFITGFPKSVTSTPKPNTSPAGGASVIDPVCGSGSLLLAAAALGARTRGFRV